MSADTVNVPREALRQLRRVAEMEAQTDRTASVMIANWIIQDLAASPSVGGWEDISTAPKDGSDILILANGMAIEARYAPGEWGPDIPGEVREYDGPVWVAFDDLTQFEIEEGSLEGGQDHHGSVTHWMPLPPPPSVSIGSRPQEAVPTEQAEPAVVGDDGWIEHDGGPNPAPGQRVEFRIRGFSRPHEAVEQSDDLEWRYTGAFGSDIIAYRIAPQPADGCSSNEGAAPTTPPVKTGEG